MPIQLHICYFCRQGTASCHALLHIQALSNFDNARESCSNVKWEAVLDILLSWNKFSCNWFFHVSTSNISMMLHHMVVFCMPLSRSVQEKDHTKQRDQFTCLMMEVPNFSGRFHWDFTRLTSWNASNAHAWKACLCMRICTGHCDHAQKPGKDN